MLDASQDHRLRIPRQKTLQLCLSLAKSSPIPFMKYQDPFVRMVIRRIVPLFLASCWMMLALPAAAGGSLVPVSEPH